MTVVKPSGWTAMNRTSSPAQLPTIPSKALRRLPSAPPENLRFCCSGIPRALGAGLPIFCCKGISRARGAGLPIRDTFEFGLTDKTAACDLGGWEGMGRIGRDPSKGPLALISQQSSHHTFVFALVGYQLEDVLAWHR